MTCVANLSINHAVTQITGKTRVWEPYPIRQVYMAEKGVAPGLVPSDRVSTDHKWGVRNDKLRQRGCLVDAEPESPGA